MKKVNERVANIRIVAEINWQIKEVVAPSIVAVYLVDEILELVLVRNVSDHESCLFILIRHDFLKINDELLIIATI